MSTIRERVEEESKRLAFARWGGMSRYLNREDHDADVTRSEDDIIAGADLAMRLIVEELRSEEAMVFQLEHEEQNQDWVVIPLATGPIFLRRDGRRRGKNER